MPKKFDPLLLISTENAITSQEELGDYLIQEHFESMFGKEFARNNPYTPEVVERMNKRSRKRIAQRCAEQGITVEEYHAQIT